MADDYRGILSKPPALLSLDEDTKEIVLLLWALHRLNLSAPTPGLFFWLEANYYSARGTLCTE